MKYMALVIWSLISERRILRSIACGPEKIFFYLAHLARQGYRSALPNTLLFSALSYIYGRNGVIPCKLFHATAPLRISSNAFNICWISRIKSAVVLLTSTNAVPIYDKQRSRPQLCCQSFELNASMLNLRDNQPGIELSPMQVKEDKAPLATFVSDLAAARAIASKS